ncbi:hypothetical protein [Mycolicibacterium phocaicum]|uniref:hypothetical protein n=1 Tax=Mycolicibacterium phocaicum TaxID=319706 RepID=UPI001CFABA21|nr:hypothetical protein [Mycolicibacterium phocaicum]UCZ58670.1 hypothetical protein LHJ73_18005 [Mycolicibacterium phocaicum]
MSCCDNDDDGHYHDYCCRCVESDADRAQQIIEDILDDSYSGEVKFEMPLTFTLGDREGARQITDAIIAVLKHEDVI